MTLQEIESYEREYLTCAQVAPILGANPYAIHMQAMADPSVLGFPVVIIGRRVKIPRRGFLRTMKGEKIT